MTDFGPDPDVTLAIDPGDKHVGWAIMEHWDGDAVETGEYDAPVAVTRFESRIQSWRKTGLAVELVVEEFVLYPHAAGAQSWSQMRTSEMIGALKLLAHQNTCQLIEQGANIKIPTRKQLRGRGIKQIGVGGHSRDAELHLYYRTIRRRASQGS